MNKLIIKKGLNKMLRDEESLILKNVYGYNWKLEFVTKLNDSENRFYLNNFFLFDF